MAIPFPTQTDTVLLAVCPEVARCGCKMTSCFIWCLLLTRGPPLTLPGGKDWIRSCPVIVSLVPHLGLPCPFSYISVYFLQMCWLNPSGRRWWFPAMPSSVRIPTVSERRVFIPLLISICSSYSYTSGNLIVHIKPTEKDCSFHLLLKTSLVGLGNRTSGTFQNRKDTEGSLHPYWYRSFLQLEFIGHFLWVTTRKHFDPYDNLVS